MRTTPAAQITLVVPFASSTSFAFGLISSHAGIPLPAADWPRVLANVVIKRHHGGTNMEEN